MIAAAAFALAIASAAPAPAASPDPYAIYKAAMLRLSRLEQPAFIDDTEHWTTLATMNEQQIPGEHEQRTIFDSAQRRECVLGVPFDPQESIIIGDSYFAPDVWLVRGRTQRKPAANAPDMQPDLSDLRIIASVVAVAKPSYEIRFAGTDSLTHDGSAYHLTLRPLSDPEKQNLRDLWINTQTSDIVRAVMVGTYRPSEQDVLEQTSVLEDFGRVGNYWLVIHHVWTYNDPFSGVHFQYDVTSLTMRFPSAVPAWFFDEREFSRHLGEVTSTLDSLR